MDCALHRAASPSCSTGPASPATTAPATTACGTCRSSRSCPASGWPRRATPPGCASCSTRRSRSTTHRPWCASRRARRPTDIEAVGKAGGADVLVRNGTKDVLVVAVGSMADRGRRRRRPAGRPGHRRHRRRPALGQAGRPRDRRARRASTGSWSASRTTAGSAAAARSCSRRSTTPACTRRSGCTASRRSSSTTPSAPRSSSGSGSTPQSLARGIVEDMTALRRRSFSGRCRPHRLTDARCGGSRRRARSCSCPSPACSRRRVAPTSGRSPSPPAQAVAAPDVVQRPDPALDRRADAVRARRPGRLPRRRRRRPTRRSATTRQTYFANLEQLPVGEFGYALDPASLIRDGRGLLGRRRRHPRARRVRRGPGRDPGPLPVHPAAAAATGCRRSPTRPGRSDARRPARSRGTTGRSTVRYGSGVLGDLRRRQRAARRRRGRRRRDRDRRRRRPGCPTTGSRGSSSTRSPTRRS